MRVYMDFGKGKVGIDEILIKAARRKGQKKDVYVNIYDGKLVRRVSSGKNGKGVWEFLALDVSQVTGKPKATWLKSDWDDNEYLNLAAYQYILFYEPNIFITAIPHHQQRKL